MKWHATISAVLTSLLLTGFARAQAAPPGAADDNPNRGFMGVAVVPIDKIPEPQLKQLKLGDDVKAGVLLANVIKGGPADKAGLKMADVITGLNGKDYRDDANGLMAAMKKLSPGKEASVIYFRGGEEGKTKIVPAAKADIDKLAHADGGGSGAKKKNKNEPLQFQEKFDRAKPGELPEGWKALHSGEGETAEWAVKGSKNAASGSKVLQIEKSANPSETANLCLYQDALYTAHFVTVKLRALSGDKEKGGGIVFGEKNKKNYYDLRLNPELKKLFLDKVVDGKVQNLKTVDVPVDKEWNEICVQWVRGRIIGRVKGTVFINTNDETFKKGKVGLLTRGDAETAFDDLRVDVPMGSAR